ncbi:glycosyltransferase family 2 protein [Lachnospiraceae bacterium 62-26]
MISVVIPTYNREKTIKMAVDSVLDQTYRDIELIIVDDASTDNTKEVISKMTDERIHYVQVKENAGACNARNIGAKLAKGEYIAFQDSDDWWHSDKLEKQYRFMEEKGLDFSFCGMTRIMLENPNRKYYYPNINMDDSKEYFEQLLYLNRVGTQTIMCKSICFEKIEFDVALKRFQDWDFALQASRNYSIGYLRESLVDSFVQLDSISKNSDANNQAWRNLYEKYMEDIARYSYIKAKYLFRIGNEIVLKDQSQAVRYYKESLSVKKSLTTGVFLILSLFRMKKIISFLLDYQKNRLFK